MATTTAPSFQLIEYPWGCQLVLNTGEHTLALGHLFQSTTKSYSASHTVLGLMVLELNSTACPKAIASTLPLIASLAAKPSAEVLKPAVK